MGALTSSWTPRTTTALLIARTELVALGSSNTSALTGSSFSHACFLANLIRFLENWPPPIAVVSALVIVFSVDEPVSPADTSTFRYIAKVSVTAGGATDGAMEGTGVGRQVGRAVGSGRSSYRPRWRWPMEPSLMPVLGAVEECSLAATAGALNPAPLTSLHIAETSSSGSFGQIPDKFKGVSSVVES